MKRLIIIGAGGNSKVIIDLIHSRIQGGEDLEIMGILDDDKEKSELMGYPSLGPVESIDNYRNTPDIYFVNGIGDNKIRKKVFERFSEARYYTAIHPSALIGSGVSIGAGAVVMPGAIINVDSTIGKHALINTGAIIEHDNVIGDFVHVASGAATAGNVIIKELSMLGTGVKVIQGISIGRNTMVGAGAVVISDIPDDCTTIGVPAKVKVK